VATQANFFRRHGRNGFLGAGKNHNGNNFHAVFSLAQASDLTTTSITYYDCSTGTSTSVCLNGPNIGTTGNLTLGQNGNVDVTDSSFGGLYLYEVEFTPTNVANHILTSIDANGQTVLEESYLCDAGYEVLTDGTCSICAAGNFAELGAVSCTPCAAGTADIDLTPSSACTTCPDGSYSSAGSTTCTPCAAGTADIDTDPSSACIPCTPGEHSSAGSTTCTPCAAGTVDIDTNPSTPCTPCGSDEYQRHMGETDCDTCGPGWVTNLVTAATTCTPCTAGTFGDSSTTCADCGSGEYQTNEGQTNCDTCGSGSVTNLVTAATACNECGVNTYAFDSTTCNACPASSTTLAAGSDSLSDCACPAGTGGTADGCATCSPGTYDSGSDAAGQNDGCTSCIAGQYLDTPGNDAAADCKDCGKGKWSDTVGGAAESTCTNCAAGKYLDTLGNDAVGDCKDCAVGKVSVAPADDETDCLFRSLMYGYAWLVDAPNTCDGTGGTCTCTSTCVQWHGELTEGFNIAKRASAGIVEETDSTLCALLKDSGQRIKQQGCTG